MQLEESVDTLRPYCCLLASSFRLFSPLITSLPPLASFRIFVPLHRLFSLLLASPLPPFAPVSSDIHHCPSLVVFLVSFRHPFFAPFAFFSLFPHFSGQIRTYFVHIVPSRVHFVVFPVTYFLRPLFSDRISPPLTSIRLFTASSPQPKLLRPKSTLRKRNDTADTDHSRCVVRRIARIDH